MTVGIVRRHRASKMQPFYALIIDLAFLSCILPGALSFCHPLGALCPAPARSSFSSRPPLRPSAASLAPSRTDISLGLRVYGAPSEEDDISGSKCSAPPRPRDQETEDRYSLIESGMEGMKLYDGFKDHLNKYYTDLLKCIAMKLHDPSEEPWSHGDLLLHQAQVQAIDSRGFDIQVTLCKESTCWLSVVHARFPYRSETPCELFTAFDIVCQTCMCSGDEDVGHLCKIEEEIAPEYFEQMMRILNKDFLQQVNTTVCDLAGISSAKGEYLATLKVSDVTKEGFRVCANFCNVDKCSSIDAEIEFPRPASDLEDFQDELMACLEDSQHKCQVKDIHVFDDLQVMLGP